MQVFHDIRATVSTEFLNAAPSNFKIDLFLVNLAIRLKIRFERDSCNGPTFEGPIETIYEVQKTLLKCVSDWSTQKTNAFNSFEQSKQVGKNESNNSTAVNEPMSKEDLQTQSSSEKECLAISDCKKLEEPYPSSSRTNCETKTDELDNLFRFLQLDNENSGRKREILDRRQRYEENQPFISCTMCSFKTKRQSHFAKHLLIHQKISELHECNECGYKTLRASTLRRHRLVHSVTEFPCPFCSFKTFSNQRLQKHIMRRHNPGRVDINEASEQAFLKCQDCDYECHSNSRLRRHKYEVHSTKRPYMCEICGYMFKRSDTLLQHRILHGLNSKFTCECGKICRSSSHLMQHKSVHSTLRPYKCETCGVSFKTKSIQKKHHNKKHKNNEEEGMTLEDCT